MAANNQGIFMPRMPGYIDNSEWYFADTATFAGAFAAPTSVIAKAAGGARTKNVITDFSISCWTGATLAPFFWYLVDGLAASFATLRKDFIQFNMPANSDRNTYHQWNGDYPIIGSLNTQVAVVCSSGGVAGCSCQVLVRGYQIAA